MSARLKIVRFWTPADVAKLQLLCAHGHSNTEIGKITGRSRKAVSSKLLYDSEVYNRQIPRVERKPRAECKPRVNTPQTAEQAKRSRKATTSPLNEARHKAEKIPRVCNLCSRKFTAPTRFIRTCTPCKNPGHT